jgi:spore cortex formation protein SpoVR/YcgB (stage V sporulation)
VLHAGVFNPGHPMRINPYYLGYRLLVDIEQRWDQHNYGAPRIVITKVNQDSSLSLEHERSDLGPLDLKYAEKTLEYVHELWKRPILLKTFNSQDEVTALTYTAAGMEVGR